MATRHSEGPKRTPRNGELCRGASVAVGFDCFCFCFAVLRGVLFSLCRLVYRGLFGAPPPRPPAGQRLGKPCPGATGGSRATRRRTEPRPITAAPDSLSRLRFPSPAPARAPSPQDSRPPWDALFISSPSYISLPRVIFKGCEFSDLIKTINPTRGVSPVGRLGLASCTCQN